MECGYQLPRRARLTKVSLCLLHAVNFSGAGAFRIYSSTPLRGVFISSRGAHGWL